MNAKTPNFYTVNGHHPTKQCQSDVKLTFLYASKYAQKLIQDGFKGAIIQNCAPKKQNRL